MQKCSIHQECDRQHAPDDGEVCQQPGGTGGHAHRTAGGGEKEDRYVTTKHAATVSIETNTLISSQCYLSQ